MFSFDWSRRGMEDRGESAGGPLLRLGFTTHLEQRGFRKISALGIAAAEYNATTDIVGACTEGNAVVLMHVRSLSADCAATASVVSLPGEQLRRFAWLNNHEFVTAGVGDSSSIFNIVSLTSTPLPSNGSSIYVLKKADSVIFSGQLDGWMHLYDTRCREEVGCVPHSIRRAAQPLSDIEVAGNYVYTATMLHGLLWQWDCRHLGRRLGLLETGRRPSSLKMAGHNLLVLNDAAVLRVSASLTLCERVCKDPNGEAWPQSSLDRRPSDGLLVWNRRDRLCLANGQRAASYAVPGLSGFEVISNAEVLLYTKDGSMSIGHLEDRVCLDADQYPGP